MVKKIKSKKGVEGGLRGVEEQKEKITEVDKEWFQIQIKSLEEKLLRRNEKMRSLEQSNSEYQEKYEQLREDKADIIAYLKRTLQQRTDQISEFQARLEGLQQVYHNDAQTYQTKLDKMSQEAARTKEQLASENMVLAKKLDALEEFRIQRDQLMSKFQEQEKKLADLKREYQGKLESMEKKHILEEDRLKKDMIQKLESVAAEFRKASHAQMSATTQRTIRENVSVSAEVTILAEKLTELTSENDNLYDQNKLQKKSIEELEEDQVKLLHINAHRMKIIEDLALKCNSQHQKLREQGKFNAERCHYEERIGMLERELNETKETVKVNLDTATEKETAMTDIKIKLAGMARTKDLINNCLSEASGSIKAALALQVEDEKSDFPEADVKSRREEVLNQLLLMLNMAMNEAKKDQGQQVQLNEEENEDVDYLHGSLGLVPLH